MRAEGIGGYGEVWLWDGATQYEGRRVRLEGRRFAARVRPRRVDAGVGLGKRVPRSFLELQRQFRGRRFLGHLGVCAGAPLVEVEIESVQGSSDGAFDYLLSGTFRPLPAGAALARAGPSVPGGTAPPGRCSVG